MPWSTWFTASFVFHPTAPLHSRAQTDVLKPLAEASRGSMNRRSLCHAFESGAHLFHNVEQIT